MDSTFLETNPNLDTDGVWCLPLFTLKIDNHVCIHECGFLHELKAAFPHVKQINEKPLDITAIFLDKYWYITFKKVRLNLVHLYLGSSVDVHWNSFNSSCQTAERACSCAVWRLSHQPVAFWHLLVHAAHTFPSSLQSLLQLTYRFLPGTCLYGYGCGLFFPFYFDSTNAKWEDYLKVHRTGWSCRIRVPRELS